MDAAGSGNLCAGLLKEMQRLNDLAGQTADIDQDADLTLGSF
jgi:hypothetical protein